MESGPERQLILDIFRGLRGTFLDGHLILGGSSGLFGFPTATPAFTEDLDFLIDEDLVATRGGEILKLLSGLGFQRVPDTPTFTSPGRPSFDLVGYSTERPGDHLSAGGVLQVMVFDDLGRVLSDPESIDRQAAGGPALSPAAFVAVKLLTTRVEKGAKDKLQALLVLAERVSDAGFRRGLTRILEGFDAERRKDVVYDAQLALLSCQKDPAFRDHGAEGYTRFLEKIERGFQVLIDVLRESTLG